MENLIPPDSKLFAIDLRDMPDDKLARLRQEAIRRGISPARLMAQWVREASERLLSGVQASNGKEAA